MGKELLISSEVQDTSGGELGKPVRKGESVKGCSRWKKIANRSGLTTLALAAGIGSVSLLYPPDSVSAHDGSCEVAVQIVGVRFINRVGDPNVFDQGDEIVGKAGNFTAFIQTSTGEALTTIFVGADGVATSPRFIRQCNTTGINGQAAVSLQLRTDQGGRVLPFTVEDHNARRVWVGREVEQLSVPQIPAPIIPEVSPPAASAPVTRTVPISPTTRLPDGEVQPVNDRDFWRTLAIIFGITTVVALLAAAAAEASRRRYPIRVVEERDRVIAERDGIITERDEAVRTRDEAIRTRDEAIRDRDSTEIARHNADQQRRVLTTQLNDIDVQLREANQAREQAEQDGQNMEVDRNQLRGQYERLADQVDDLAAEAIGFRDENRNLSDENTRLQADVTRLQEENELMRTRVDNLEQVIGAIETEATVKTPRFAHVRHIIDEARREGSI